MAAAELQTCSKMSGESVKSELRRTVSQECRKFKDLATDHLVMRDFKNCHQICLNGLSFTRQHPEEECAQMCTESLCVLCIQALAEMNRWPSVLPLVQDIYNGLEACPYTVIQLCLLLHAKVNEYSQCYAMASIWLRCKDNAETAEYGHVVEIYIKHVMMPQHQLVLVPQFLNSCTSLSEREKEDILRKCEKLWSTKERVEEEEVCSSVVEEHVNTNKHGQLFSEQTDKDSFKESRLLTLAKHFGSLLTRHMSFVNLQTVFKVAIVSVGLSLLLYRASGGALFTDVGRASAIWRGTLKILKTMFTPFHPGR